MPTYGFFSLKYLMISYDASVVLASVTYPGAYAALPPVYMMDLIFAHEEVFNEFNESIIFLYPSKEW